MTRNTVVVTDGARGLGGPVGRRLAADGARVAVLDADGASASEAAAEIEADGGAALPFEVDITDRGALNAALAEARAALGPIDILINSAEASSNDDFFDIPFALWERLLDVNLTATFHCCQAVLPDMVARGWGRIVNLTSAGSHHGRARRAPFIASKTAVEGLTKALALEFAPRGITINAIPTGMVNRPILQSVVQEGIVDYQREIELTPVGRVGTPEDVAALCAFLVSDGASYLTGQIIGLNGGRET